MLRLEQSYAQRRPRHVTAFDAVTSATSVFRLEQSYAQRWPRRVTAVIAVTRVLHLRVEEQFDGVVVRREQQSHQSGLAIVAAYELMVVRLRPVCEVCDIVCNACHACDVCDVCSVCSACSV